MKNENSGRERFSITFKKSSLGLVIDESEKNGIVITEVNHNFINEMHEISAKDIIGMRIDKIGDIEIQDGATVVAAFLL